VTVDEVDGLVVQRAELLGFLVQVPGVVVEVVVLRDGSDGIDVLGRFEFAQSR